LVGAAFATRVIVSFLFETRPIEPLTFAMVALILGAAAMFAAWIPARRAAQVDPVASLRAE
jgi:putative ABC transport system permease protein